MLIAQGGISALGRLRTHAPTLSCFSHVQLFAVLWTIACPAPLSTGFSRQEYWSVLPFPSPEDLPDPGMESVSSALQVDSLSTEPPEKPELSIALSNFFGSPISSPLLEH